MMWVATLAMVVLLVRTVTAQVIRTTSELGSTISSTVERIVGGPEPGAPEGLVNQSSLTTEMMFSPAWMTEGAFSGPDDENLEGPPDLERERGR